MKNKNKINHTDTNTQKVFQFTYSLVKKKNKNLPPLAGGLGRERSETLEQ